MKTYYKKCFCFFRYDGVVEHKILIKSVKSQYSKFDIFFVKKKNMEIRVDLCRKRKLKIENFVFRCVYILVILTT